MHGVKEGILCGESGSAGGSAGRKSGSEDLIWDFRGCFSDYLSEKG